MGNKATVHGYTQAVTSAKSLSQRAHCLHKTHEVLTVAAGETTSIWKAETQLRKNKVLKSWRRLQEDKNTLFQLKFCDDQVCLD